jgi:hypothetical protein
MRHFTAFVTSLLIAACGANPAPDRAGPGLASVASGRFCADAQQRMATTRLEVLNVVHPDYDGFVKSKPRVRPFETEEFHWYEDDAHTRLKMVSCKMKTVDHLRTEYGRDATGEEGTCAALNALTLRGVLARLPRGERRRLGFAGGSAVVFDEDVVVTSGPLWLEPFPLATIHADGSLHVVSKAMRKDWTDPRYQDAPVQFRGVRYCHLIAPDYLERVLLGYVQVPAA